MRFRCMLMAHLYSVELNSKLLNLYCKKKRENLSWLSLGDLSTSTQPLKHRDNDVHILLAECETQTSSFPISFGAEN